MEISYKELNDFTYKIIGVAMNVHRKLSSGFLEKVYENALALELKKLGIPFVTQKKVSVYYEGEVVGDYTVDILIDNWLLLELKAMKSFSKTEEAQCVNYLKALDVDVCLLFNFGAPSFQWRRFVRERLLKQFKTSPEKLSISRKES